TGATGATGATGPTGPTGPAGAAGAAGATPTFTIGTVTAGDDPQVTITGTPPNYVLNFVIPNSVT
ncbi:MAG: collagen-like protein, partial [Oscillospiraceae bacterium]|nr:collagen-like protein [Oscillospiraceae bacterium]